MLFHRRAGSPSSILLASVVVLVAGDVAHAVFATFSVGGDATTASITPTVDAFRTAIGSPNNGNAAGPLLSGRREINWDGGGVATGASAATPFNGFLNTRGASFTTPGTGFLQTPVGDPLLTAINPSYATTFAPFSAQRIFVPVGSNVTDVTFAVPGTNGATPATVSGFGVIFTDVDLPMGTSIQFFDTGGTSLYSASAPASSAVSGGFSFLGAVGNAGEQIARVRITTGNQALGANDSNGNPVDVVGMDDVLYPEPLAIPEPAGLSLFAGAAVLTLTRRRRRRRDGR